MKVVVPHVKPVSNTATQNWVQLAVRRGAFIEVRESTAMEAIGYTGAQAAN